MGDMGWGGSKGDRSHSLHVEPKLGCSGPHSKPERFYEMGNVLGPPLKQTELGLVIAPGRDCTTRHGGSTAPHLGECRVLQWVPDSQPDGHEVGPVVTRGDRSLEQPSG